MKRLEMYMDSIKDELCSARDYAESYVYYKNMKPQWSKMYHDMAMQELQHASNLKEMGMEDQCVITSVSLDYLKRVKEAEPELKTGYILAAAYGSYYKNEFVDFISIRSSLVTKKQIQAAHEYGKAIHVWTVNSRSEIEQMALMGVDNIITDYPTRAKEVLYQPDVAKNLLTYIRQVMK